MSGTLPLFGLDLFGQPITPTPNGVVAERFIVEPFSVLNARAEAWKERKRAWLRLGIRGEIGRESESLSAHSWFDQIDGVGARTDFAHGWNARGVSVFDPVLCELAYRWFSDTGAQVVDPFAGGSVRGIVAGMTGRRYWGCDLRAEQIKANQVQADNIGPDPRPVWVTGDSRYELDSAPFADLVFSCPPYGSLEKYSDNPSDLSAMEWPVFLDAYRLIVAASVDRLKMDRFACFVVGDFRDRRGRYRNFVSETIRAFLDAGCDLYNEGILLTSLGSAAMRVTKQFRASRKLCKVHQNVLVFVKGDGKRAAKMCGEVAP